MAERTIEANGIRQWTEDFGDHRPPALLPIMGAGHGKALAAAIPGAKLPAFDGMGHNLPVQVWPEIIREMLAIKQRGRA